MLKNEKGMATIESIGLIFVFILLTSFGLGFFGAIHTGIVNSISARQYAFETFKNRSNLQYFRSHPRANGDIPGKSHYKRYGYRFHSIVTRHESGDDFIAPARNISITPAFNENSSGQSATPHNSILRGPATEPTRMPADQRVNPIWVKAAYGICLNATCGGS